MSGNDTLASASPSRDGCAGGHRRSHGLAERLLLRALRGIVAGRLELTLPGGVCRREGAAPGPRAALSVTRPSRLLARLLARGDLGFAEAYVAGDWDSPDPEAVLRLAAVNEPALGRAGRGMALLQAADRLLHRTRRNDRRGSRRNIAFHYDLGNAFYRLWLDPGMSYSAACFAAPDEPLEEAQARKNAHMLDLLEARAGDRVLEIGCGWGGLALAAARRGLRVTGITLSREQLAHAREQVRAAGLQDRVELRLQDYREVDETFDHVVSVEMFEAVGEAYWPEFFARVHQLLRPGGRAAMQVITIDEAVFPSYRRGTDFIQRYIFPGGMLPSVTAFQAHAAAAGLRTVRASRDGRGYAETLRRWRDAFERRLPELEALGFDARFQRLWRYYLCYCEAGFELGRIDLLRTALHKPG